MTVIEIKIKQSANGKKIALYRHQGSMSTFWHYMPVSQAEKAIKSGCVSIGFAENVKAVQA